MSADGKRPEADLPLLFKSPEEARAFADWLTQVQLPAERREQEQEATHAGCGEPGCGCRRPR